ERMESVARSGAAMRSTELYNEIGAASAGDLLTAQSARGLHFRPCAGRMTPVAEAPLDLNSAGTNVDGLAAPAKASPPPRFDPAYGATNVGADGVTGAGARSLDSGETDLRGRSVAGGPE